MDDTMKSNYHNTSSDTKVSFNDIVVKSLHNGRKTYKFWEEDAITTNPAWCWVAVAVEDS
jgi:hypothetical protein